MGPLAGVRLIEIAGIGPGPMAAMMLGDLGADVIRVDRLYPSGPERFSEPRYWVHGRSRRSIAVDLRKPGAAEIVLRLAERADGLMEPFRPGVAERLGIGPEPCLMRNKRLVYGRMTGWGQEGPLARVAGHDINYIALSGVLHAIGPAAQPIPPLNLVADFGGGGMLLAFGMVCGILEARSSGRGQVVDAAMMDGAALLFGNVMGAFASGQWQDRRASNMLDGGAPFYGTYETKDGRHIAVGAIEPQFYSLLLEGLGLSAGELPAQMDRAAWPEMKQRFGAVFRTRTRDEWCRVFDGSDACVSPVLSIAEASIHPHAVARGAYAGVDGVAQPAPGPRFSRTPAEAKMAPDRGQHTVAVLREAGFGVEAIAGLRAAEVVGVAEEE